MPEASSPKSVLWTTPFSGVAIPPLDSSRHPPYTGSVDCFGGAMVHTLYTPGACNIGSAEIALRRWYGWGGLVVTVFAIVLCIIIRPSVAWWAGLVVPATVSACGFIQAEFQFCLAFGFRHVFNFSDAIGRTERVTDPESRKEDARRSILILGLSLAAGVVVTAAAIALRSLL